MPLNTTQLSITIKIERFMAICCIFLVVVFSLQGILNKHQLLIIPQLALIASLSLYLISSFQGNTTSIHIHLCLLALATTIAGTMYYYGLPGALWAFPAIVTCSLVRVRKAGILIAIGFTVLTPLLGWLLGIKEKDLLYRLTGALALTTLISQYATAKNIKLQEMLMDISIKDPLTGCFNRRYLYQLIDSRQLRDFSLILIDIDNFKDINDTYGHDIGDNVLVHTSKIIKGELLSSSKLFRIGGEEFLIVSEDVGESCSLAGRIRIKVQDATMIQDRSVTISLGQTLLKSSENFDQAFKRVDINLYKSKKGGRNRVTRD